MAKAPVRQVPNIWTAAGNINHPFEPLGLVHAVVVREESGCGGGLPVSQAIKDVTDDLMIQAHQKGANGLIHINYMHRVSASRGCNSTKQNIEIYGWGTAVRIGQ